MGFTMIKTIAAQFFQNNLKSFYINSFGSFIMLERTKKNRQSIDIIAKLM